MKHKNKIFLITALSAAFICRFYFLLQDNFITTDGARYALSGKSLIEGRGYETFGKPELIFPPSYPLLIGLADYFFDDLVFSARFISFIFGFLLIPLLYAIGKKCFDEKAGLFAALFSSLHITLIEISSSTFSESSYLFFLFLSIYVYFRLLDSNKAWLAILLGSIIGFSYLIRPEGIIVLALSAFFFVFKRKEIGIKKSAFMFLSIIFSFFIIISPYVYFLHQHTGEWTLTNKASSNIVAGLIFDGENISEVGAEKAIYYEKVNGNYDEENNRIEVPEEFNDLSLKDIFFRDPDIFLKRYLKALKTEIAILTLELQAGILFLPLAISLIYFCKNRKYKNNILILLIFPLIFFLTFPLFHIESRYLIQILIFIILLSSFAFSLKSKYVLSYKGVNISSEEFMNVLKLIIVFTVVVQFFISMVYLSTIEKEYPIEHKIAGKFLASQNEFNSESDIIMSRKPFVSFFSSSRFKGPNIPYTTPENVLRFARSQGVKYIVIDERFLGMRENYKELLFLDRFSDDVDVIFEDNSISPIKVFRMK